MKTLPLCMFLASLSASFAAAAATVTPRPITAASGASRGTSVVKYRGTVELREMPKTPGDPARTLDE
jgi:hypothetical protein